MMQGVAGASWLHWTRTHWWSVWFHSIKLFLDTHGTVINFLQGTVFRHPTSPGIIFLLWLLQNLVLLSYLAETNRCQIANKMKLGLHLTPYSQITSKWIIGLNVKCKIMRLLEENIGDNFHDLKLEDGFLDMTSKIKNKIHKRIG